VSPVFAHGQLRLYLLALLAEGPRHGYEVIQDLEARFGGLYTPSAGTVYPRLAKLEEEGLVERTDEGRKATYRITDAGRAEVSARSREIESLDVALDQSVRRLADEVRSTVRGRSADLRAELRAAARDARAHARPEPDTGGPRAPSDAPPPSDAAPPSDAPPHAAPHAAPGSEPGSAPGRSAGDRRSTGGQDWVWAAATDWVDVELAVGQLRRQARQAWKRRSLTVAQTREIAEIVSQASHRISEVLRQQG